MFVRYADYKSVKDCYLNCDLFENAVSCVFQQGNVLYLDNV